MCNVCQCRMHMLAAATTIQQQQQLYLYRAVPYIDLHDTKKLDNI